MKVFNTLDAKDYTVQEMYISAPMSWELLSGSNGIVVTSPDDLEGAIMIEVASNDPDNFFDYSVLSRVNQYTGTYEYTLYRSIKHLFYDRNTFYSGSTLTSSSISGIPDYSYVVSVSQNFFGDRIKPGSFELTTEVPNKYIRDDGIGNLYTVDSGNTYYVGNIFYNNGIAVIKQDTGSFSTSIDSGGLKIIENSAVFVDYSSDIKVHRHEANVRLRPTEFNFSPFNPSILSTFQTTGSVTQSLLDEGIIPSSGSSAWNLYNLMGSGIIKPYVTTIGLYNDQYELLAVAKMSEPIQRTFDVQQIFIVRFDT